MDIVRLNKNKYNRYRNLQEIVDAEYNKDKMDNYPELCDIKVKKTSPSKNEWL